MAQSDLVAGKAGPNILFEAVAAGKPFLTLTHVHGHESGNLEIIKESDVLELLKQKPEKLELIMTGRDAPKSFIDKADLVTEMKIVKHYFYQDELARFGLDY